MEKKKKIRIAVCVAAVLICGVFYLAVNEAGDPARVVTEHFADDREKSEEAVQSQTPAQSVSSADPGQMDQKGQDAVYVHICGEVKKPGVYTFTEAPRLIGVVEAAGGFTKKADRAAINQAETVTDGSQIRIPSKHDTDPEKTGKSDVEESGKSSGGMVNINTATSGELMTLNGIGESKASQIIAYRETNGAFKRIEDIMNIPGIKEGVFSKIRDFIIV